MHASKIQEDDIIISSPKDHHVMNGGCAEETLSPNLKSPDPYKKTPQQKWSHMMKSRGITGEKDSSHGGPPGLPKGINRGALSPHAQCKHRNNSSLTWEVVVTTTKMTLLHWCCRNSNLGSSWGKLATSYLYGQFGPFWCSMAF
ncbi:hypothetical protein O181_021001 [Austropuccinia psidii MF-1]|uniref:Uncharacterized protein n=1 Tax=Austropuccinia psidii MF-1 TaxID=1389203 RepID=A0A9Q3GVC1_9BASI|nr:hypothetical protein [Austropuccinia psidii MF-1]